MSAGADNREAILRKIINDDRIVSYTGERDPGDLGFASAAVVLVHELVGISFRPGVRAPFDRPLDLRLDLRNHSPLGFEWGYGGSGPAQLALAILADVTGDDYWALAHYQDFKRDFIEPQKGDRFEIPVASICSWIKTQPIREGA
jgi:hypothetical protein